MVRVHHKRVAGRKVEQVRRGARQVFLREGFAGASVDEIAREAAVSKATLYAYFPDKHLMFKDAMGSVFEQGEASPMRSIALDIPVADGFPKLVGSLAHWLNTPRQIELFRLAASEALRFPDFVRAYRNYVGDLVEIPVCERLENWTSRGQLVIDDIETAARQLVQLCDMRSFGEVKRPGKAKLQETAENTISLFLGSYGVRSGWNEKTVALMQT